jgi:hypothetical protein
VWSQLQPSNAHCCDCQSHLQCRRDISVHSGELNNRQLGCGSICSPAMLTAATARVTCSAAQETVRVTEQLMFVGAEDELTLMSKDPAMRCTSCSDKEWSGHVLTGNICTAEKWEPCNADCSYCQGDLQACFENRNRGLPDSSSCLFTAPFPVTLLSNRADG